MSSNAHPAQSPIVIVTPDFAGPTRNGGIGTACFHQARVLSKAGYPVTVLFAGHNESKTPRHWVTAFREQYGWEYVDAVEWGAEHVAQVSSLPPFHGLHEINWSYVALQFLKNREFKVAFFQDYLSCGLRAMQYKQAGLGLENTRMVLTLHSYHQWIWEGMGVMPGKVSELVRQEAEIAAIRLADALISPSAYMASYTAENVRGLTKPIEVIPYCFEGPPATAREAKRTFGPFEHLIFFGRLETRKGLRLFLDAINTGTAAKGKIKKITFLGKQGLFEGLPAKEGIVKSMQSLKGVDWQIIDNMDANEAIKFLNGCEKALVVAPSLMDNLPLALIELFAYCIPFLTSNVGGIPEILGSKNLNLCANPNATSLRHLIDRTIETDSLTIDYSEGFNPRESGEQNLAFLESQLNTKPVTSVLLPNHSGPALSVLVPHYNSTAYLKNALNTLRNQDIDQEFEVIVVDDLSTNPAEVAQFERMAETWEDKRVRFIKSPVNRGPSGARNFAAAQARADWLVFFDCDNEAAPNMLSTMHQAATRSGLDFLTIFTFQIPQADSHNPRVLDRSKIVSVYMPVGPAFEAGAIDNTFGDACAVMRRSAFEAVGGFSSKPGSAEDWELFATLCFAGYRMGVIPEPLMYYRNMESGYSKTANPYTNLIRILTRYGTPEAAHSVNWLEILKFAHGATTAAYNSQGCAEESVYSYFAKLEEKTLAQFLLLPENGIPQTPLVATLHRMRAGLKPLLRDCLNSRMPPKVLIYGIGEHTMALLGTSPLLMDYITGFIDRRPRSSFLGQPCYRPEDVTPSLADVVVYSSAAFEQQMYENLKNLPVRHILLYGETGD